MPRKSQKSLENSAQVVLGRPTRGSAAAVPQEKPAFAVDARKTKASSEVGQASSLSKSNMADTRNFLQVSTANLRLPVAPPRENASDQLEVLQTRQGRRVREMENADTNPSTAAALLAASKRSASPLPPSFFDANKKKIKMSHPYPFFDNSKPKSSDAKLPMADATPKHMEGKFFKKSEFESNEDKENTRKNENSTVRKSGILRIPLTQCKGQDPAPKPVSSIADLEEASCDSMEISARGMLGPAGKDKYYLEQFHKFYADYRASNAKLAKRLLKLDTSNTQKYYENMSLKNRLSTLTEKIKNLENKLSLQDQLNGELHEKYLDALKARTDVEKSCKSQLEEAKALIELQGSKLGENQSKLDNLKAELENMEETNRGMASAFSDLKVKLKSAEETASNLLNQNNKQTEELEEQKIKIQETVAEREVLERRNVQLESELEEMTQECNDLKQRQVDFEELQLQHEEIENQLEAMHTEKETVQNFLNERIQELEASRNVLIEINEEYSKESIELKAEKEASNETISILRSTVIKQTHDLKDLQESNEQLQGSNLQQLSLHSAELQEHQAQKKKLEEIIKSLEDMVQAQAQSLKAEQENRIKETHKGQELKAEFEGERERYQADIDALKTALAHRDRASSAEQAKMESLEAELAELKKINSSLKDESKQKDNDISAAKKVFDEEVKTISNNLKRKIFGLQEDLKQKDIKLIGLEHEKNGIINQLKHKMSTICSTIEKPIIASAIPSSPEPVKSLRRLPRKSQDIASSAPSSSIKRKTQDMDSSISKSQDDKSTVDNTPSSSAKKRKTRKIGYINIMSDFESDDDELPVKMMVAKRENLAVVMPQENVFDALKKGTI